MDYVDIVTKIENKEHLSSNDVTGVQLMNLLREKVIKDIVYKGTRYEINFIPITYSFDVIEINEETCATFIDATKMVEHWIHCYDVDKEIFIHFNNTYFMIILDILETKE